jgi:hypothetical protein
MKKWVVKKNKKYLKLDDIDAVWTKDINKAILYDIKPVFEPMDGEDAVRVEVFTKEIK